MARGQLLDLHAALGRGNEHHALETTIHEASEVKLARNGTRGFDKQPVHRLTRGSGLGSHQTGPQKLAGGLLQFLASLDLPDASSLAAATGMNLRLDHPAVATQRFRGQQCFLWREGWFAGWNRDAVLSQQCLSLIFV